MTAPPGDNNGYYLLAYHLLIYAVACKPCNSGLKKDYFPIAGDYDLTGEDPAEMGPSGRGSSIRLGCWTSIRNK